MEAIIQLEFVNGATIECLLDTGFGGAVLLPEDVVAAHGFPIIGDGYFRTVGQKGTIKAEMALAGVKWLGDEFDAPIVVSETDFALIGVDMLVDTRLEIDYTTSTVVIQKVACVSS